MEDETTRNGITPPKIETLSKIETPFEDVPSDQEKLQINVYEAIIKATRDAIIMVDVCGTVQMWNQSAERVFGWKEEEAIGKRFHQLLSSGKFCQLTLAKMISEGIEIEVLHRDGHPLTIELSLSLVQINGEPGWVCIARDVSARKLEKEEIRKSEEKYKLLFNSTRDSIVVHKIGENGVPTNFVEVNDTACKKLGYTKEEMLKLSPVDIDSPECSGQMPAFFEELFKNKQVLFETEHISKNGDIIPMEISTVLFSMDDGLATMSVARDITKRKSAEKALLEKERLSAVGETAGGVAHDFNNALQGIVAAIEMIILETNLSSENMDDLVLAKQMAFDAASRAKQLQRFAALSRKSLEYSPVDIKSVLEDVVFQTKSLWNAGAQKQGLIIDVAISCQDNSFVLGNSGELRSVLFNLVKNSVEAMPKGGKINIDAKKDDKDIVLTVTDTGIGMDENTRLKAFQPFFTTKDFGQGRGFGMNTVQALIIRHNGSIKIKESVEGVGTTVEIRLPSIENKPVLKKEANVEYVKSARVLWVDDDKIIRELGNRLLKGWGHSSALVASGQEALDLLESNEYDLMIIDIGMPGMNGYSLLEKIKGKYEDMKRIVLSGWVQDVSKDRKNNLKIEHFLEKPTGMKQLQDLILEIMQTK